MTWRQTERQKKTNTDRSKQLIGSWTVTEKDSGTVRYRQRETEKDRHTDRD